MNIALWIAQIVLAAIFLMAGNLKALQYDQALAMLPWVKDVPHGLVTFIGIAELLGAVGLLLPSLTRIQPRLTVVAALGIIVVMVMASGFHIMRGEYAGVGMNLLFAAVAGFIAYGRSRLAPIAPRTTSAA